MTEKDELLSKLIANIYGLGWALQDAPFFGVSAEQRKAAEWALDKVLEGTGYDSLSIKEAVKEESE